MVHHRRPQAVGRTGNHAKHQSQQGGAQRHHKRAADRRRRAAQQAAQDVATEIVGTEKERHFAVPRPGRRQQLVAEKLLVDAVRSEPAAENAQQRQRRTAVQADHGGRIAVEFSPYGAQRTRRALLQIDAIVGHTIPYVSVG